MNFPALSRRYISRWLLWLFIGMVVALTLPVDISLPLIRGFINRLPDFATIFLGIFIEAAPFLLFGTLASGFAEVFIPKDWLARLAPGRPGISALLGGMMGFVFPVCECGVVPLTRRLLRKGLPLPAGIAFLLAAPVLNPIVIASTAAAFGWGRLLLLRVGLSLLIAVITGLVFAVERQPWPILRPTEWVTGEEYLSAPASSNSNPLLEGGRRILFIAQDEFFEMGRYLVIGAAMAAGMQVFIPQSAFLAVGQGPLISVVVMVILAVLLSICSTVDAFVALSFSGAFSAGSILAFLVFGPMVDIKSVLMYGHLFRARPVLYIILIPLLLSLLGGLLVNYYLP